MVSLAVYRGRLHRVSEAPREWPMPPRKITLEQFRILTRKRDEAIARMATAASNENPSSSDKKDDRLPKVDEEEVEVKDSDPQPIQVEGSSAAKEAEDSEMIDAHPKDQVNAASDGDGDAVKGSAMEAADVEMEVAADEKKMKISNNLNTDKEKRRIEVEGQLEVLKQKKHNLVQMLKQILNVEEEIKRRNAQSAALRSAVSLQAETAVDMGSATRHVPKLSVEVNFSGDMGAEMDATANLATHSRQLQHVCSTSPSASLTRPVQQNPFLPAPRPILVTSGHGQTPSIGLVGNTAVVSSSPSRFAPSGHKGHHYSASLPPVSVPGANSMVSSPFPAASGVTSSVFRDSRHTSSS